MRHFWCLVVIFACSLLPAATGAQAQKRVALVVGNSAYAHTPSLLNPSNDAADMAAALKSLGFEVIVAFDLDKASFDRKIREFATQLQGAAVGVLFYAGHGLQVAGQNYLVPVDAELATAAAADFEMVRLDIVQRAMERESSTNIMFLDAFRDNLLARNLARAMGSQSSTVTPGLAAVESGVGTLISFSTQPGNVALDGAGRNSQFVTALLKNIVLPGEDLPSILINVRNDVIAATGRRQVPWEHSALTTRFYFSPPALSAAPEARAPVRLSEAAEAWDRAKDANNVAVLEAFQNRYSGTFYADLARARMDELAKQRAATEDALRRAVQEAERRQAEATQMLERSQQEMRAAPPPMKQMAPAPSVQRDPCRNRDLCTSVSVFFGTDRKQQESTKRVDFGRGRADTLQLGHAIVTVPRAVARKRGEIPVASWWDKTWRGIPEGDPSRHFTIPTNGVTVYSSIPAFLAAVRSHMGQANEFKNHAVVFVHGYRMTFDAALFRAAQITYDLGIDGEPFGTAFLYSWPSGGGVADYKYDFDSARLAVQHLRSFLTLVIDKTSAKKVHLIAHSMGNWPLLTALEGVKKTKSSAEINQVILAAPDIDAKEFLKMAAKITTHSKGATLYASSNDIAMKAAREVHRGAVRAGDVPAGGPVVVKGIDTIDISVLSTDAVSLGHTSYADRRELLNDVALLFRTGVRPPHVRTPIYERVRSKDTFYWKYPQ